MQGNVNIPDSNITTNLTFRQLVLMNMQQLTNFPYIEKDFDALTDYELLCLVVKFLNDVIANQNEQNTSITNLYNSFLALQTYVNNTKDTLEDAFNELDDYVRNYFDNLDVQDEIDHKLDEYLADGTLEHIIASYLQTQKIYNTTIEMIADASNLVDGLNVETLGYYSLNDGGGAFFQITDTASTSDYQINLNNGLYATLIVTNKTINVNQLGAVGDGVTNDHDILNTAIQFIAQRNMTLILDKIYLCNSPIVVNGKSGFKIKGDMKQDSSGTTNSYISAPNGFIELQTCRNVTIEGIAIRNLNNGTGIAVTTDYSPYIRLINCDIIGTISTSIGVYLETAYYSVLRDCRIHTCKRALVIGKESTQDGAGSITVDNCKIGDNGCCYYITTDSDVNIVNSTSENCGTFVYSNCKGLSTVSINDSYFGDGSYQCFIVEGGIMNITNLNNRVTAYAPNNRVSEWGTTLRALSIKNATVNVENVEFINSTNNFTPYINIEGSGKFYHRNCKFLAGRALQTDGTFYDAPREVNYITSIGLTGTDPINNTSFNVVSATAGTNYMGSDKITYTNNDDTLKWGIGINYTVPNAGYYMLSFNLTTTDNYLQIHCPVGTEIFKDFPISYVEQSGNIVYVGSRGIMPVVGNAKNTANYYSPNRPNDMIIPIYIDSANKTGTIYIRQRWDTKGQPITIDYLGLTRYTNVFDLVSFN